MTRQTLVGRSGPDVSVEQSASKVRHDPLEVAVEYRVRGALRRAHLFANWMVHEARCELGFGLEKEAFRKRRFSTASSLSVRIEHDASHGVGLQFLGNFSKSLALYANMLYRCAENERLVTKHQLQGQDSRGWPIIIALKIRSMLKRAINVVVDRIRRMCIEEIENKENERA